MRSDTKATTVEDYLASLPEERRIALSLVRDVVRQNLPEGYVESMNWGMISYEVPLSTYPETYNGQPLMYAALASQKKHMSLYLTGIYMSDERRAEFARRVAELGKKLDAGKSCVRFKSVDDLPLELIAEVIASEPVEEFCARFEGMQSARKAKKGEGGKKPKKAEPAKAKKAEAKAAKPKSGSAKKSEAKKQVSAKKKAGKKTAGKKRSGRMTK